MGGPFKDILMRPKKGLAAFPQSLLTQGAERQPVDEAAALVPFRLEHQSINILPPCRIVRTHFCEGWAHMPIADARSCFAVLLLQEVYVHDPALFRAERLTDEHNHDTRGIPV
ncbi:hypothetical protein ACD578_27295 (plasmid) [Microvirga sp. RSM25]|uniref:hypothetical protein n=1 Tax=Microvirga sp. RSM25 TaxID=3273802 RepID=UPI003850E0CE